MKRNLALPVLVVAALLVGVAGSAPASTGPAEAAASRDSILCLNKAGNKYRLKVAPSTCAHFGPGGSFGGGVNLEQLQWTRFGHPVATATGIECGFHLPCANIPVEVTAFRLRKRCGDRFYTRLRATSSFGTTTVKAARCPGPV